MRVIAESNRCANGVNWNGRLSLWTVMDPQPDGRVHQTTRPVMQFRPEPASLKQVQVFLPRQMSVQRMIDVFDSSFDQVLEGSFDVGRLAQVVDRGTA